MKIAVVDLVTLLGGGGYKITNSLYDFIASGNAKNHEWLFIVSNHDFESNEYVKIIKIPNAAKNNVTRAYNESFVVKKYLKDFNPNITISMPNMRIMGNNIRQIIYVQQPLPFQKEKKFSFFKAKERPYAFRQYIQGMLIKKSIKKSDATFVQTEWIKDAIEQDYPNSKVIKIGYPIDSINQKLKAQNLSSNFFYPCSSAIYKNVDVLVRASNRLIKKGLNPKIYITLPFDVLKSMTTTDIDDPSVFICLGNIPLSQVLEMYTKTTLLFPSYIETLGLPMVEAKEAETWIIASDCPFSHEILDDYPNKNYFKYYDDEKLAEYMENVMTQKVVLQHNNNISTQVEENCWNKMVRYLEENY